jgi:uncharacterized FAD-dependent dehydrogenase
LTETADAVIFGAGPAGLAAALAATNEGRRVVLIELGKEVTKRERDNPSDLVTGVGGAGLYSDGKFSFYPAASQLWRLRDRKALWTAYTWLADLLAGSTEIPSYPDNDSDQAIVPYSELREKIYLSKYIGFTERLHLVEQLSKSVGSALITGSIVTRLDRQGNEFSISYEHDGQPQTIRARAVILACGRFGGLELNRIAPWIPAVFRRYEVGVRLESTSDTFFLQHHSSLDPKYIVTGTDGTEWRTFCVCRNGENVRTDFLGLTTYSGRSDARVTKSSNVGLNVRITEEPEPGTRLQKEIDYLLAGHLAPFELELQEFMRCEAHAYGRCIDELLRKSISALLPDMSQGAGITGPCIEGVGYYPDIDGNLKIRDLPMWVAGDETGVFRGLTAAFISGHYAARQVHQYLTAS